MRDNITFDEARMRINKCMNILDNILHHNINEACDQIMYDYLGLERDYLPLLIDQIV